MATAQGLTKSIRQITAAHLTADLSDRQLLERYADRRDEAAFTALVRRHGPLVLSVCRRLLHDGHAAEDAFQATFLVLARRAGSLGRPESLGPWLHGVAARVARKARSRALRRRAIEQEAATQAATAHDPEELVWQDLRPVLDEAVGGLPEKLRVPFVLHYLQGQTVTAIARQLGCPRGTVATHLTRARLRLRARLVRRGVTLSAAALGAVLARNLTAAAPSLGPPGSWVKALAGWASGQATVRCVPVAVADLAQGGLQIMSLRKSVVIILMLLLGLGAVGGGTVMLAQAPPAQEEAGPTRAKAPAPTAKETDLSLFREGGQRFHAEDYRGADLLFSRLMEKFPDSSLAPLATEMAIIAKEMGSKDPEWSVRLSRAALARRIIDAALAGASAAEAGQRLEVLRSSRNTTELMHQFTICFKEGKYKAAEKYALAAFEGDPGNFGAWASFKAARDLRLKAEYEALKGRKPEKEIEQILQRSVHLDFKDAPLTQVLDDLSSGFGLNIVLDHPALEKEGISPKRSVSVHLDNVSLRSALPFILDDVRLTYTVRDGALLVTTPTVARGKLVRQIYPVSKLVGRDAKGETLIHLIMRTISPATWDTMGGEGTIDYYPLGRALIVNQTPDVQEQIADFLAALRSLTETEEEK
jgi:RNA polymerase sigma factor (sigma-70 family)